MNHFIPTTVNICFFHLITEFLAFQEGLLYCSVESLHLTICLGVIGTCDVMSNACELIELLSDLENRTNKKKVIIQGCTQILWLYTIYNLLGHTLHTTKDRTWLYMKLNYCMNMNHTHLVNILFPGQRCGSLRLQNDRPSHT